MPKLLATSARKILKRSAASPVKHISIALSANSRCFPDHCRYCAFLAKRGVRNFIVSFGEPKIQHAKVKALGLDREPSVEKIYFADRNNMLTKEAAFRKIQKRTKLTPGEILVVGDRAAREIRAGKELGMHTVRLLHGEFKSQKPVGPEEEPDYVIGNISEVRKLPFVWGDSGQQ